MSAQKPVKSPQYAAVVAWAPSDVMVGLWNDFSPHPCSPTSTTPALLPHGPSVPKSRSLILCHCQCFVIQPLPISSAAPALAVGHICSRPFRSSTECHAAFLAYMVTGSFRRMSPCWASMDIDVMYPFQSRCIRPYYAWLNYCLRVCAGLESGGNSLKIRSTYVSFHSSTLDPWHLGHSLLPYVF